MLSYEYMQPRKYIHKPTLKHGRTFPLKYHTINIFIHSLTSLHSHLTPLSPLSTLLLSYSHLTSLSPLSPLSTLTSHHSPQTRFGSTEKASSLRQPAPGAGGKGGVANAFGLLGGDDDMPKGQGALKTEVLPKAGDDLPGLLKENDGPEDDDKYIGAEDGHDDDHAVTGHLIYDVYKAVALG